MIDFGEILDKLKRGKGNLTDKEAFLLLNKGKDRLSEEEIFDLECIVARLLYLFKKFIKREIFSWRGNYCYFRFFLFLYVRNKCYKGEV